MDKNFDLVTLTIIILALYFIVVLLLLSGDSPHLKNKLFRNGFLIFGIGYPLITILLTFTLEDGNSFFPKSLTNLFAATSLVLFSILSDKLFSRVSVYITKESNKKISKLVSLLNHSSTFEKVRAILPERFISPVWEEISKNEFGKNVEISPSDDKSLTNLLDRSSKVFTESLHILKNKITKKDTMPLKEINGIYSFSLDVYSDSHGIFTDELFKFTDLLKQSKESIDIPYFIVKQFNDKISSNNYQNCLNTTEIKTIKEFYTFARIANPEIYVPENSRRIFVYDLNHERDMFNNEVNDISSIEEKCTGTGDIFKKGEKVPYLFWLLERCFEKNIQLRFIERNEAKMIADDLNFKDKSILDFTVKSNLDSRLVIGVAQPQTENYLKIEKIKTLFNITDKNNEYCKFCKRICEGGKLDDIISLFKINMSNHSSFLINVQSFEDLKGFLNQQTECCR